MDTSRWVLKLDKKAYHLLVTNVIMIKKAGYAGPLFP
jgi:hypothetical protein